MHHFWCSKNIFLWNNALSGGLANTHNKVDLLLLPYYYPKPRQVVWVGLVGQLLSCTAMTRRRGLFITQSCQHTCTSKQTSPFPHTFHPPFNPYPVTDSPFPHIWHGTLEQTGGRPALGVCPQCPAHTWNRQNIKMDPYRTTSFYHTHTHTRTHTRTHTHTHTCTHTHTHEHTHARTNTHTHHHLNNNNSNKIQQFVRYTVIIFPGFFPWQNTNGKEFSNGCNFLK